MDACSPYEILIETERTQLNLWVNESGKLFQRHFGRIGAPLQEPQNAYPASGDGWVFEPALEVTHSDGNTSTDLRVVECFRDGNLTRIALKDPEYQFHVSLCFRTYPSEDVIEVWTEIRHDEEQPVTLTQVASSSPDFGPDEMWLTQFHGDWNDEVQMHEERLSFGIKNLDSKLGVRAHQFRSPWFLLSRGAPAQEDSGEIFAGSLAWSGSFSFKLEVDPFGRTRVHSGINSYASAYLLEPGEIFETPKMVWGWSDVGTGKLSRNLHRWVRRHALRKGEEPRSILLNNWEATYFTFDETKIVSLFDGAKLLGMELFLLDDGWFGQKYPRDDDTQGLGDWEPDPKKLPNGLKALTSAAEERGLRFGIWLEPEMVNPKSELFEDHPAWAIQQPKRALELQRNQLILDITQPDVCEFVFEVADRVLSENPGISYVKWDCNRYITQPGSPVGTGTLLWVDYVRNLYKIFDRLTIKYPDVEIMMCSGGGGRVDYGAMKYAHEFWPSDRTDPVRRVFIQWGYSHFFPAISLAAHVTSMGERPLKFSFDVAMSGRLGMDMDVDSLSEPDRAFAASAISTYKTIRNTVQLGELFRLESPYKGARSSLMYVLEDEAILFVYCLGSMENSRLKLKGLQPGETYSVEEINRIDGQDTKLGAWPAQDLMEGGMELPPLQECESAIYKFSKV